MHDLSLPPVNTEALVLSSLLFHSLVSTSVTTMGLENWIRKPHGYSPVPLLIFTVLSRTTEKENVCGSVLGKQKVLERSGPKTSPPPGLT